MPQHLRIMCWNIEEECVDGILSDNAALPRIADQINIVSPDLVLVNEVRIWNEFPFGSSVNQVKELAKLTGISYLPWDGTVAPSLTGH